MRVLKEFVNNLKMALRTKKKFFIVKHKLILIKILQYLYTNGFIKKYEVKDVCLINRNENTKIIRNKIVLVHFPTVSLNTKIIDVHSSLVKNKENITYKELVNNKRKDLIILISTTMGLMTDAEAIRHKKGGIILCVFELQ